MVSLILSLQVNTHILAKKLDLRILWWLLGGSNPVKGDFLVIAGATLYAVSNVTEEFLVKNADVTELMAFLGLFGAIIAAIQMYPSNNKAIIFLFILNFYEHFP
jgi:drug/metabolite transporter (DMT)-like permease